MTVIEKTVGYRLLILWLGFFLAACVPPAPLLTSSPTAKIESKPGVKLVLGEQALWNEYNCSSKTLPFIVIEQYDISPPVVRPGQEFRYHFVYAACTLSHQKTIKGSLARKIYFKGSLIFQDTKRDFLFKPGRWDVTALVRVPPKTTPGTYNFELTLKSPVTTITRTSLFVIQR